MKEEFVTSVPKKSGLAMPWRAIWGNISGRRSEGGKFSLSLWFPKEGSDEAG